MRFDPDHQPRYVPWPQAGTHGPSELISFSDIPHVFWAFHRWLMSGEAWEAFLASCYVSEMEPVSDLVQPVTVPVTDVVRTL